MLYDIHNVAIAGKAFHIVQLYNPQRCKIGMYITGYFRPLRSNKRTTEENHVNKKNILLITILAVLILLVYTVDLFKLNYRLADWEEFDNAPVAISHIQYFVADTPNIIGYTDHTLGKEVTCSETVAYVETDTEETYRCCDTREQISCLKGDFSSDIPTSDEQCITELQDIFGVPDTLAGTKEYQFYGSCSGGRFAELTVVQLDDKGMIQWKYVKVDSIQVATSVLRCGLGPILLLVVLRMLYVIYQEKTAEPVRRI